MGGQLESLNATQPPDSLINPIRVGGEYARQFGDTLYEPFVLRAQNLGYKIIIRLDGYKSRINKGFPYQNWTEWENYVKDRAQKYGLNVIYDVWNEPTPAGEFWSGTWEQYCEAYVRAYRTLVSVLGDSVKVSGPSTPIYND